MKKKRFTEEQIVQVLSEGQAGTKVQEICRKHGISTATYYAWKAKYNGMGVPEIKRLKALEAENGQLKKLVADLSLDIVALKDVVSRKW